MHGIEEDKPLLPHGWTRAQEYFYRTYWSWLNVVSITTIILLIVFPLCAFVWFPASNREDLSTEPMKCSVVHITEETCKVSNTGGKYYVMTISHGSTQSIVKDSTCWTKPASHYYKGQEIKCFWSFTGDLSLRKPSKAVVSLSLASFFAVSLVIFLFLFLILMSALPSARKIKKRRRFFPTPSDSFNIQS